MVTYPALLIIIMSGLTLSNYTHVIWTHTMLQINTMYSLIKEDWKIYTYVIKSLLIVVGD